MATLIERAKGLILSPKSEWDAIEAEQTEPMAIVTGYVAPLAAVPAIANLIGMTVFGVSILGNTYRPGIGGALVGAIVSFIFAILAVYVFAFLVNMLAPNFGAQKDFNRAFRVSAYFPTPIWVAGIFSLIPALGILGLVGLIYAIYLLFVGLPKVMKPDADKATTYTIVSIVAGIMAWIIVGIISSLFVPKPNMGQITGGGHSEIEKRSEEIEKAAKSGDINAVLGALSNSDGSVADPDALRTLAPEQLSGLKRKSLDVETMSAPFNMAVVTADYSSDDGDKDITLKVTSSPTVSAMLGMAGVAGGTYDRQNEDGYEKLSRKGDMMILEEWDKSSRYGRYGRVIAKSFLVEADGRGVDMDDLKKAVESISEKDLTALPKMEPAKTE